MADALTSHQQTIAANFLQEQAQHRHHLVVHLSGAHAYGFASVNSDLDLKAIHIAPTEQLLGLTQPPTAVNQLITIEGVEVDYTSNEINQALRGILKGDGNMLERILSGQPLLHSEKLSELQALAQRNLSKQFYFHYRGFARAQRHDFEQAAFPLAKKALYVLRTALTGIHLLETGTCSPDLGQLWSIYHVPIAQELIAIKRQQEKQPIPSQLVSDLTLILNKLFERLDQAYNHSYLPDQPAESELLSQWLIHLRTQDLITKRYVAS